MSRSNTLIQQLLSAEEDADRIVAVARDNRTKKLKEAHVSAEEEIAAFKEREKLSFERQLKERYGSGDETDANRDLEELAKKQIEAVKKDYRAHKDSAVNLLISGAVEVHLRLEEVQKRFIRECNAGRGATYH